MAKRKVVLVTAFENVVVSHFVEQYQKLIHPSFEICAVIQAEATVAKTRKFYLRKIKKALHIGILGVLNGIRMRGWYKLNQGKSIQEVCKINQINYFRVPLINHKETIHLIQSMKCDLGVSMGNSFISARVFKSFKQGMINTHGEILPAYQNAQSVIWQLYNNSTITGFTIHQINEHIDQGAILYQEIIDIRFSNKISETVKQTNQILAIRSLKALLDVVQNYDQFLANAKPQGEGNHYTTPGIIQFWKMSRNNVKLYNESSIRK